MEGGDGKPVRNTKDGSASPPAPEESPRTAVLDAALRLLSVRSRSIREMKDRLEAKGFSGEEISVCIRSLQERGLLDDRAFAAAFVRDRVRLSPRSPYVLKRELRERGISPDLAEGVPFQVLEEEDLTETDLAVQVARAWVRKQAPKDGKALLSQRFSNERERARRRLMGFLARRGFNSDAARKGLEAAERAVRGLEDSGS